MNFFQTLPGCSFTIGVLRNSKTSITTIHQRYLKINNNNSNNNNTTNIRNQVTVIMDMERDDLQKISTQRNPNVCL